MNFSLKERMNYITIAILLLVFIVTVSACGTSQESTDPASVIQAHFEALGAGDVEEALALVADDATFNILGDVFTGKAQIREEAQKVVSNRSPSYELSNIQVDGDKVTYTNKVTIGSTVHILTSEAVVQDGKIVSVIDR